MFVLGSRMHKKIKHDSRPRGCVSPSGFSLFGPKITKARFIIASTRFVSKFI